MQGIVVFLVCVLVCPLLFSGPAPSLADDETRIAQQSTASKPPQKGAKTESEDLEGLLGSEDKIEAAVVHPFQTANVGAEVSGVVEAVKFNEGERVEKNGVVYEIARDRYEIELRKAEAKLKGAEEKLRTDKDDLKVQEELMALGSTKMQEVIKARSEVEISAQKLQEAREDLRLATLNLEACSVKAPFAGYLA